MRIVVVGLGGVGAMAAWRLTAEGHAVTALEQFQADHDRGSSYGDSRIVRRVYPQALYTQLMGEAYDLWARLMSESGDTGLFVQCGGIFFGPAGNADVIAAERALSGSGVAYERLDAAEGMRRFPAFKFETDEAVVYEPTMGYARASRAVRAAIGLAKRGGASILEGSRLVGIETGARTLHAVLVNRAGLY